MRRATPPVFWFSLIRSESDGVDLEEPILDELLLEGDSERTKEKGLVVSYSTGVLDELLLALR
ncbi:UDP-glucosyltransferase family protein [Sesbania bispinosa]|nr:UDP-glucosyltransferase family protein [Sesbania bispinosa]